MKFSATVPVKELRKVYGYYNEKGNTYYWRDNKHNMKYFDADNGTAGTAVFQNTDFYKDNYTPIYEPFSLNIGK